MSPGMGLLPFLEMVTMVRTCSIDGCDKPTRSGSAEWCKMHYHRWYRHGSTDKRAPGSGITASHGRRYKSVSRPQHPLVLMGDLAEGRVYVHRMVLYDAIGPGSHGCHWCARLVTWSSTRGDPDCLMVDHVNGVGDDNRLENLVPACIECNAGRSAQAKAEALRAAGWWSSHDTVSRLKSQPRRAQIVATTHVREPEHSHVE